MEKFLFTIGEDNQILNGPYIAARQEGSLNLNYSAWQNHTTHAEQNHTTSNPKRLSC